MLTDDFFKRKQLPVFLFIFFAARLIAAAVSLNVSLSSAFAAEAGSEAPVLTENLFARGQAVYEKQCAVCHGLSGRGDGQGAYLLYPKPRNFTRGEFRNISSADMKPTNQDLYKTITRGMPGSSMPSWSHLSDEDRWALVYYVRYLTEAGQLEENGQIAPDARVSMDWNQKNTLAVSEPAPDTVLNPQAPLANDEAVARGKQLFIQGCSSCHGAEGRGDGKMSMKDSLGIPLRPRDLTTGIFKGDSNPADLYRRIALGLPGSPMPGYKDAFTEEQIWDMVHYIRTLPRDGIMNRSQTARHVIRAKKLGASEITITTFPWDKIAPEVINLMPLWWRDERIESVEVRAVYDEADVYLALTWRDSTENRLHGSVTDFSDGTAIQFSGHQDPPVFVMGSASEPVIFWHWKAGWENEMKPEDIIAHRYPNFAHSTPAPEHFPSYASSLEAENPVASLRMSQGAETGRAAGLGSYTTMKTIKQETRISSVYKDGQWQVLFKRALTGEDGEDIRFEKDKKIQIAFAVWDGAKEDRNGQKSVSIWNEFILE